MLVLLVCVFFLVWWSPMGRVLKVAGAIVLLWWLLSQPGALLGPSVKEKDAVSAPTGSRSVN